MLEGPFRIRTHVRRRSRRPRRRFSRDARASSVTRARGETPRTPRTHRRVVFRAGASVNRNARRPYPGLAETAVGAWCDGLFEPRAIHALKNPRDHDLRNCSGTPALATIGSGVGRWLVIAWPTLTVASTSGLHGYWRSRWSAGEYAGNVTTTTRAGYGCRERAMCRVPAGI